jgi:uncharacterized membrane protein YphA (DoxX/SURF4 family)
MLVAVLVVQLLRDADAKGIGAVLHSIELPLSLLAITTAILILGPGRFSLDSLIFKKKAAAEAAA